MPSCYDFCPDVSHGARGWTGPTRNGDAASQQAQQDAEDHNQENPTHEASVQCSED
ncbi:MAG: hypothetical protein ACRD3O_05595 [Terriglobia bacterium]